MLGPRLAAQQLLRLLPAAPCSAGLDGAIAACSRGLASTSGNEGAAAAAAAAASGPPPALVPGAVLTTSKRYTPAEVAAFTSSTGDSNAIHVDSAAAAAQGLPGAILPGLLMAALFPAIIGSAFPGALYLSQSLKFKHYALVGAGGRLGTWLAGVRAARSDAHRPALPRERCQGIASTDGGPRAAELCMLSTLLSRRLPVLLHGTRHAVPVCLPRGCRWAMK